MGSWAGNLIKLARMESGLTQRELALRAGTSQPTIAAYESGRKEPSLTTLKRIVRGAGLELRIRLAQYDDHDEWVRRYEERLPADALERARRVDEELREMARAERGTGR